nr:Mariner Mos1 transposase [Hymenolepis microstoma]
MPKKNEKRPQCNERHDNARPPHVAKLVVKKYLETLKLAILPHPPQYSPDVAPSHFHLTHLAQWPTAWLTSASDWFACCRMDGPKW